MSESKDSKATGDWPGGLGDLRQRIDTIDEAILELLNQRAEISLGVGRHKAGSDDPIFKPSREKAVVTRLQVLNPGPLPDRHLYNIYREIMSSSRRLQRPERVVYLGPEGTFSYFAGIEYMGHLAELNPKPNLEEIFRAVAEGEAELGIVPLENSLQGTVGQTVDLFMRNEVSIQSELFSRISHCLLSRASSLSEVANVYSHSNPLGQCGEWLQANLPDAPRLPMASTAAAARLCQTDPTAAVVGHARLAEMFGLNILAEHIEDLQDNWTRFFIIGSRACQEENRDKSTILFTTPDKPGALHSVLELFTRRGVNMSKLESRPFRGERWKYVFFADLDCDLTDSSFAPLIKDLRERCHTLRLLGSYPTGPHLESND